jgi:hypothetical protein
VLYGTLALEREIAIALADTGFQTAVPNTAIEITIARCTMPRMAESPTHVP